MSLILSLIHSMEWLVVKVLVKQISLICFRAYLEVYVAKNPTCFSRWSFRNAELLKKFNIFGCQKHGWLPNSYGRKRYKDMSKEEQEVIKSFEGEKSYEKTVENPQYYLSGNQMLQIGMSEQ